MVADQGPAQVEWGRFKLLVNQRNCNCDVPWSQSHMSYHQCGLVCVSGDGVAFSISILQCPQSGPVSQVLEDHLCTRFRIYSGPLRGARAITDTLVLERRTEAFRKRGHRGSSRGRPFGREYPHGVHMQRKACKIIKILKQYHHTKSVDAKLEACRCT